MNGIEQTALTYSGAGRFIGIVARVLVVLIVSAATLAAQTTTGIITGLVTDAGGAIIPGSSLTLTNLDTNQVPKQMTNEPGAYSPPAPQPGNYRLEWEHPGFKRFVQEPVDVRVQQTVTV